MSSEAQTSPHNMPWQQNAALPSSFIGACPIMIHGVESVPNYLESGNLSKLPVRSGETLLWDFYSADNNLCGISLRMQEQQPFFSKLKRRLACLTNSPVRGILRLLLFEEFNPVPIRACSLPVKDMNAHGFGQPFRFDAIGDSGGRKYTVVLEMPAERQPVPRYWSLTCCAKTGSGLVTAARVVRDRVPLVVPYYRYASPVSRTIHSSDPLVSVLIVTYNAEGRIRRCLESIYAQDYANVEVVVVDNGSSDNTLEIIRNEFPAVKLLDVGKNLDFCAGNNVGVPECAGEFIYVLNADTVLNTSAIRLVVECIQLSPHIGVVGSTISTRGSITRYADTFLLDWQILQTQELLSDVRFIAAPCGASFLFRKSLLQELEYLFDNRFVTNWEDHDLGLRCWLNGYICIHLPWDLVWHEGAGVYGFHNPRRDTKIVRNTLLTYFRSFAFRHFMRAFYRVLRSCRTTHRLLGMAHFLAMAGRWRRERAKLQARRKLNDQSLGILTGGLTAFWYETDERDQS